MQWVSKSCELIGKLAEHFCYLHEEEKENWHKGLVQAMPGKDSLQVFDNDSPDETQ